MGFRRLDALWRAMFTLCNAPTQLVHCAVGCAKAYSEWSPSPACTRWDSKKQKLEAEASESQLHHLGVCTNSI